MTTEFSSLNLRPELEQAITALGYTRPTPHSSRHDSAHADRC